MTMVLMETCLLMNQLVSFAAQNNAIKVALPKVEKAKPAPALAVAASDSLLPPDPPINANVPLESQLHATVGFASNPERGEFKPLSERVVVVLPTNPSGNYVVYYNPDPNEYCAANDAIFFSYGDRNSFTGTKDYRNTTLEYDVVKKQNKDEVNRELLRKHIAVGDLQLVPIVPSYISPGKTFMQVGRPITVNNAEYVLLVCYNMELFQELTKADGLQLDDQNNYAGHIAVIGRS